MSELKRGVYRFERDFGRSGALSGIFIEDADEVAAAIGRKARFGEVLGKHSDVECELAEEDIVLLTDDPSFVEKFREFKCWSGINPLRYLACEKCGWPEDDCQCEGGETQ